MQEVIRALQGELHFINFTTELEDSHPELSKKLYKSSTKSLGTPAAVSFKYEISLQTHRDSGMEETLGSCP